MKKRIGITQSLMTLANAACGFLALTVLVGPAGIAGETVGASELQLASALILIGLLFDTLDGKIARLTNHESVFGAQLDSLADMITFGVAPAVMIKAMLDVTPATEALKEGDVPLSLLLTLLFVVCAVLRLARFNTEKSDEERVGQGFTGLPSPAAAGLLAAATLFYFERGRPDTLVRSIPYVLPLLGLLMVSRVPYAHLGSRLLRGKRPFTHLLRLVFVGILAAFLLAEVLLGAFVVYLLSGPVRLVLDRVHDRATVDVEEEGLF